MSNPEDAKPSQRFTVRFRQLCTVSRDAVLAVSEEGVLYERQYNESADLTIWRRLTNVSSTNLEVRQCIYPECEVLMEKLPEDWESIAKPSCDLHRYNV